MAGEFQVKLGGHWRDYREDEDKILKKAFKAGFPNCKYSLRGQTYEYNFKDLVQINLSSGKQRQIRPPYGWKQPATAVVPPGRTMTIKVPSGRKVPKIIKVPHPDDKGVLFTVNVPPGAKPGQEMFVPVPKLEDVKAAQAAADGGGAAPEPAAAPSGDGGGSGWSTGAKVGAGVLAAGVVGVGAVAGVMIAEHGVDGAADLVGDLAGDAGDVIGDVAADAGDVLGDVAGDAGDLAGDAGEFIVDAADTAGDFIMDLF